MHPATANSAKTPTAKTTTHIEALVGHMHGNVVLHRDNVLVSRLVIPAGTTLAEHPAVADTLAIGLRGKGVIYVQQEVRHVSPGEVIDLNKGESFSVDAEDEVELIFVQGH
jgi:quercetin dioxygenase-like cupin family protein